MNHTANNGIRADRFIFYTGNDICVYRLFFFSWYFSLELERKLVDTFEEYARRQRIDLFDDVLLRQHDESPQHSGGGGGGKQSAKGRGATPLLQLTDLRYLARVN